MRYQIWECTAPECRLRFPVGEEEMSSLDWVGACPRCRTAVRVCGAYEASGEEVRVHVSAPAGTPSADPAAPFHALLDNLRSAHNVGAIFRTADGVGVRHLYLCGITPPPEHPHAAAAALGAHKALSHSRHANAFEILRKLKEQRWLLWALECGQETPPLRLSLEEGARELAQTIERHAASGLLLIVGSERYGVDPECLRICDAALWIPMLGRKGSFNAATAFGIAAYRLRCALSPLP